MVHKSVTGDNKYAVDTFGNKTTTTKSFKLLSAAKAHASQQAKRLKLKSYQYHDAYEKLTTIKVTKKQVAVKKRIKKVKRKIQTKSKGLFRLGF